jgi:hypothetical protein
LPYVRMNEFVQADQSVFRVLCKQCVSRLVQGRESSTAMYQKDEMGGQTLHAPSL